MTALTQRDAQRQHDSACDCCGDSEGEWLDSLAADFTEGEITNMCAEAGIDDTLLQAGIYAWRNKDADYFFRMCERLAGPVIQQAARDEAERLGELP